MLNLHVVLAIDRAGLVGDDGPTHHGVFDVGFLRQIPGMQILCPVSFAEQQDMLRWAVEKANGPVAIRYPRGTEGSYTASDWNGGEKTLKCHRKGKDITILTYGSMLENAMAAAEILAQDGIEATVLRLMDVSDLSRQDILEHLSENKNMVVLEEVSAGCGVRDAISILLQGECHVSGIDLGAEFVPHGSVNKLYELCGLDAQSVVNHIREVLGR